MKEILLGGDRLLNTERLESHDFRVPAIKWNGYQYELSGMGLPDGWEKQIEKIKNLDFEKVGKWFEEIIGTDCELIRDKKTGLIRELAMGHDKKSRVFLETLIPMNGYYLFENINDLPTASTCLEFFSRYLSAITDFKLNYPYITGSGRDRCCSQYLKIPDKFFLSKDQITYEKYQKKFCLTASNIAGQFGSELADEGLLFDERGILTFVQVKGDRCTYDLDDQTHTYYPHNVDTVYDAAALHGIVAEFINNLLRKNSNEPWR